MNEVTMRTRFNKVKLKMEEKSPELFLAGGLLAFAGTVFLACRATLKAQEVVKEHEKMIEMIEDAQEISDDIDAKIIYTNDDMKRDKLVASMKTAVRFMKLYAPAVALGAMSVTCILVSRNILHKRYLGAVAAYNGISELFQQYRKRVVDEQGEIMDRHYMYGTELIAEQEEFTDENGKKKKREVLKEKIDPAQMKADHNAKWWDESSQMFDSNPEFARMFLLAQQNYFSDLLHKKGKIYLNEVYDRLGFQPTEAGQIVGWKEGAGDDYIDFGLYDEENENTRNFMNGLTNHVLLTFNHDGIIWDGI